MKFIILVKATKDYEAGVMPSQKLLAEMGAYHEEGGRSFVYGPFAETKELVAGYTIIDVKSREDFELDDFGDSPEIERFRKLETQRKN
jgi:hypothetical protein